MSTTHCLNCGEFFGPSAKFCSACGQTTATHRLTIGHLLHEVFHAVTHADKGIFNLVKILATRPYKVAIDYVEGSRKKYFNPVTFFLHCVGTFIFINSVAKLFGDVVKPDPKVVAQIPTEAGRQNYIALATRSGEANAFMSKNTNIVSMIAVPFYAGLIWLFFRRRGRKLSEIMLAVILFTAFSTLLFTLVVTPVMGYYRGQPMYFYVLITGLVLQMVYYTWGFVPFLGYRKAGGYLKVFAVMILTAVCWTLIAMLLVLYYISRENTGKVIGAIWNKMIS